MKESGVLKQIKEFRADFVEAVNGVLEKHFKNLEGVPCKAELTALIGIVFSVMISLMAIKGGKE